MTFIDTHIHLDGEEFAADRDEVVSRARAVGCSAMFVPAIDLAHLSDVLDVCSRHKGYAYPMIGLHPEEVRSDWLYHVPIVADLSVEEVRPYLEHKMRNSYYDASTVNGKLSSAGIWLMQK